MSLLTMFESKKASKTLNAALLFALSPPMKSIILFVVLILLTCACGGGGTTTGFDRTAFPLIADGTSGSSTSLARNGNLTPSFTSTPITNASPGILYTQA